MHIIFLLWCFLINYPQLNAEKKILFNKNGIDSLITDTQEDNHVDPGFEFLRKEKKMQEVIVYTTQMACPYCVKAKKILDKNNIKYTEIDLFRDENLKKEICQKSGIKTVPQIFIDKVFFGDCTYLEKIESENRLWEFFEI